MATIWYNDIGDVAVGVLEKLRGKRVSNRINFALPNGSMADLLIKKDDLKRNSTMDILRIVAMFFIVIDHLATVSLGRLEDVEFFVEAAMIPQHLVSSLIVCFVVGGVNLFFLLSGYFKIDLKPGKALYMVLKLYVYWVIGTLLAIACGFKEFASAWEAVKFMVIGISKYWFVLIYLLLMICAPLLNALADKLFDGDGKCGYFVFVTLLFFAVIGFIADYFYPIMGTNGGYSVIWAGTVYMYGRLIRKKEDKLKKNAPKYLLLYVLLCVVNYAVVAPLIATGAGNSNGKLAYLFLNYNNPLVFFASLSFFMMFLSFKPLTNQKASRAASIVAIHTLAVYLWHSNNPFLKNTRAFLMNAVKPFWAKLLLLLPNAALLFAFGIAVDMLYELLLSKPLTKFCELFDRLIYKLAHKICDICARAFCAKPAPIPPAQDGCCPNDGAKETSTCAGEDNNSVSKGESNGIARNDTCCSDDRAAQDSPYDGDYNSVGDECGEESRVECKSDENQNK